MNSQFLYRKSEENAQKYNKQNYDQIACFQDADISATVVSKSKIFPLKTVPFENIKIKVPGNVEDYLTQIYGNYMQLPPEEERKNHFPDQLDFKGQDELLRTHSTTHAV